MIGCEAVHAITRRHVAVARRPERQRVDQSFAQDDLFRRDQSFLVPHAAMLAFEIQVQRRPLAQVRRNLPPVYLHHVAGWIDDRDYERAVEVLVAALAVDAQHLQPSPHRRASGAVLRRKTQPQRPVGEAQPEPLDHLRRPQPATFQIPLRLRRLLQRIVIKVHDLQQQLAVASLRRHRSGQLPHRAMFDRLDRRGS